MRRGLVWLVLIALLPSASPQASDETWHQSDAKGDVEIIGPRTEAMPHIDLRGLTIQDETTDGLLLRVNLESFRVEPAEGDTGVRARVMFRIEFATGDEGATYTINADYAVGVGSDGRFAFRSREPSEYSMWFTSGRMQSQNVAITLDDAQDDVVIHIPKTSLLGLNPRHGSPDPQLKPVALRQGAELVFTRVQADQSAFLFSARDTMTAFDAPYVFKQPFGNLQLAVLPLTGGTVPVVAGQNQTIAFSVSNRAETKQLVRLLYTLSGTGAESHISVHGPPSVLMPPRTQRNYTVAVNVSSSVPDGAIAHLHLQGTNLAGDVGGSVLRLQPTAPMGPDFNVLYLLGREGTGVGACVRSFLIWFQDSSPCPPGFISPRIDHPNASADAPIYPSTRSSFNCYSNLREWCLMTPEGIAAPVALGLRGRVETKLELVSTQPPGPTDVRVVLTARVPRESQGRTIIDTTKEFDITSSPFSMPIASASKLNASASLLPRGTQFELRIQLQPNDPARRFTDDVQPMYTLKPGTSRLTLPLVPLPEEYEEIAKPSPFQLELFGDKDEFVNAGESRLWKFSILNQDTSEQRLRLRPRLNATGLWGTEFRPGDEYVIKAGDSVTIGLLVRAPPGAADGEIAQVRIEALDDTEGVAFKVVRAIVANSGLDLPDDEGSFEGDEEAKAAQVKPNPERTPGPGVWVLLAGLLVVARRLRSRKA